MNRNINILMQFDEFKEFRKKKNKDEDDKDIQYDIIPKINFIFEKMDG